MKIHSQIKLISSYLLVCGTIVFGLLFFIGIAQAAGGDGVYISPPKDYSVAVNFGNITWTASTTANTSVTMKVRAANSTSTLASTAWSASPLTNGQSLSAYNGNRYIQYQATLSSIDDNDSPTLHDVNIETYSGSLISSPYNTRNAANKLTSTPIFATTTTPGASGAFFQIRTAPDNGTGAPGTWTNWCGPTVCDGNEKFTSSGQTTTNATSTDGSNDQWIQYQVFLTRNATDAPTVSSVTLNYEPTPTTGVYISPPKDYSVAVNFGNITWTASTTANTSVTMKVRAANSTSTLASTAWSASPLTNGQSLSAYNGNRYIQYQATLSSIDDNDSPTLHDVNIEYSSAVSGTLISSAYDTTDTVNTFGNISWTSTSTSATEAVKFQIRTASSSENLAGLPWCGPTNCSGSDYYTVSSGQSTTNATTTDSVNDQWMQYKVTLESGGMVSPVLKMVTLQYVVNSPPQFDASYGGNGIQIFQVATSTDANWGRVNIGYSVRDPDTDQLGAAYPNYVAMIFEYSTSSPAVWTAIPSGHLTTAIATSSVATSTYSVYTTFWNVSTTLPNYYSTTTQVRITANDGEAANASVSATSTFALDTQLPTFSSFTNGTSTNVNVQYTDSDGDGVADNRNVILSLNNLVESSSSTQGVYVLFSNDGTNYATTSDAVTGAVTAVNESVLGNWKYISGSTVATATSSWTLLQSGGRSKTVYMKVKDGYSNEIASAASTTITWNKKPEFENVVISDSDPSSFRTATGTSIVLRQCNIYDTDSNCSVGKVKLVFRTRDPDTGESALSPQGILNVTYALSTDGGSIFATSTAITQANATTSASIAGATSANTGGLSESANYDPAYSTTTVYFNPGVSSGSLTVRIAVTDNEQQTASSTTGFPGVPAVYATSNTVSYDVTNPSGGGITFDAGVAGTAGVNNVAISHPSDTNTIQYLFSATTTNGTASTTPWTTLSGGGPTYLSWGFDSAINAKTVNIKFRDIYGNTQTATTTASTTAPLDANAFMIQDTSNVVVTPKEYREYISWQASASTLFASYKLEYATSSIVLPAACSSATYGDYSDVTTTLTASSTNYFTHLNLTTGWCYKYRVGVKDVNNNITIRSNAGTIGYPDGLENAGEGGGGTAAASPTASAVTNVVPTQGTNGNITVNYTLTDSSTASKTSPAASYEGYVFYNIGTYLTASSTNTLTLSDTTKLPLTNGYIQINQEVIGYASNATSTGILSGITRGTWPIYVSSGRATRVNSVMASSTSVWIMATSTGASISGSISTGYSTSTSWNPRSDSALDGNYLSGVGVRVLVHDNQAAGSNPISSQSDSSVDSTLALLDLKAPVLTASSLKINGSISSVENASSTAALSLTGVSGDTSSETVYIQFATSSNWFGAKANGSISATSSDWGDAASIGGNLGPWTWPLSGRSETVSVRMKDAYGNVSNTDTNSILKNAVPEFSGSVSDSDAASYATTTNNNVVIRQCNIYDTDSLCTAGKVKVKFLVRDPDAGESQLSTAGKVKATLEFSLNGGAYSATTTTTYSATGTNALAQDTQSGTSTVSMVGATSANGGGVSESVNYDPVYTTIVAYYDPGIASSATLIARVSVTDNESGTTPVSATSNSISYDKTAPSCSLSSCLLTFDGGIAGSSTTATITIPLQTDASAMQYKLADDLAGTYPTGTSTAWISFATATTSAWTFDGDIEGKVLNYLFRDIYGNQTGTGTASSLAPISGTSFTVDDITASSTKRVFLSWQATSTDFANYRLEYATSSQEPSNYGAFRDLITIPDSTLNYYTHSGLDQTLWYRYRLSVKNTAGNYSVKTVKYSNTYSTSSPYITAKPDGVLNGDEASANDTVAPTVTVTTPVASDLQATLAIIRFTVSDNSSAQLSSAIYYSASSTFNSAAAGREQYSSKYGVAGYINTGSAGSPTSTSVTLVNLNKNTAYKYGVEVCDLTGNCAFSDNGDAGYDFTTSNGPVIVSGSITPSNVAPLATYDTATIAWQTDGNGPGGDSQVFYSATSSGTDLINPTTAGNTTEVTAKIGGNYPHSVALSGLNYGAHYYYKIRSTDRTSSSASYLQYAETGMLDFTTGGLPNPIISDAACTMTDTTLTATWTTNIDATKEISVLNFAGSDSDYFGGAQIAQYPTSTIDNTSRLTADYGKNHTHTFSGLSANTTYYVRVRSQNRSSGMHYTNLTCKTNATPVAETIIIRPPVEIKDVTPPIISAVAIEDISATTARIVWKTDEMADTVVEYGPTMSYDLMNGSVKKFVTDHVSILSGLRPSSNYNFKVSSADARGNRAYAGDQFFTTLSLPEAAQTTKEQLEALQKELKELKEKQESEAKKAQSLAEATKRFKAILKSVASDVSLQDLEDLTTDISETITDITQEVTPPNIIGGVPAVEIEATKATIKWKTNKPANSIIALVPQPDYDAQAKDPYTLQVGQAQEEVKDHLVTIPDLRPSTVYHFQIRAKAKVGPEGRSRDFVFETKPELPLIIDYSFKKITENSITVVWRTNVLSSSLVRYTPFSPDGDILEKESKTQGNPAFVQAHEVTVSNLPPNVAYLVEISSKDVTGTEVSRVLGTVRTIIDVKAPVITKARAESTLFPGKVEKTQTIIYWETDEPSTSQIFWKEGVSKGDFANSSRLDMEYTTSHVMVMTNFKPGAVYRFQVESTDPAGNKSRSTDYTVLTPKKGETVIDLIINNFQDIFGFLKKM